MAEESFEEREDLNISSANSESYFLFLILILLFMGNSSTFSSYFKEFKYEMEYVNKLFNTLSATADGLQAAFETPQRVVEKMKNENSL